MSNAQPQQFQSMGTYLYAVTYAQPFQGAGGGLQARGIAGLPVRIVSHGDLAAIVSDSPSDQYDVTLDLVTAHEGVVEEAMQRSDVLPVSFGTVAASDQEVKERLLQSETNELHEQLQTVKNRVELGVKALWEQNFLFAQIVAEDPRIQALREQIVGTTPEQTYDVRLQLGELTDAAIQRRRQQDSQVILDAFSPLAADTRVNDIITDMMIVNAAFLVDKSQVQAFTAAVNNLQQATQGQAILQYAGPLPPYNFVRLTVHWEEPSGAIAQ
jgi:hypothetical protein